MTPSQPTLPPSPSLSSSSLLPSLLRRLQTALAGIAVWLSRTSFSMLKSDTLAAKPHHEYTLLEERVPAFYSGIISLAKLAPGDEVEITYYLLMNEAWLMFSKDRFSGSQQFPALVVPFQNIPCGVRLTLKQIHGMGKSFDFKFYRHSALSILR
jgi:hypothetical protein